MKQCSRSCVWQQDARQWLAKKHLITCTTRVPKLLRRPSSSTKRNFLTLKGHPKTCSLSLSDRRWRFALSLSGKETNARCSRVPHWLRVFTWHTKRSRAPHMCQLKYSASYVNQRITARHLEHSFAGTMWLNFSCHIIIITSSTASPHLTHSETECAASKDGVNRERCDRWSRLVIPLDPSYLTCYSRRNTSSAPRAVLYVLQILVRFNFHWGRRNNEGLPPRNSWFGPPTARRIPQLVQDGLDSHDYCVRFAMVSKFAFKHGAAADTKQECSGAAGSFRVHSLPSPPSVLFACRGLPRSITYSLETEVSSPSMLFGKYSDCSTRV